MKVWMIYMMLFGGMPTKDEARFTNESACQIYLHTRYGDELQKTFKLVCVDISPTMCQGKVCE
jgi:hypothetical protein